MANSQEVEIRALLTKKHRHIISRLLKAAGARSQNTDSLRDVYYCPKKTRSFSQIEMETPGSFSLRLRESLQRGKKTLTLNVKIITKKGDHRSWREHEVRTDSLAESHHILDTAGFKPFFKIEKRRHTFRFDNNTTAAVEDIKKFGPILEIEIMTSKKDAEAAKNRLYKLLTKLEIKNEQIVKKSVTNLLMRRWSKF